MIDYWKKKYDHLARRVLWFCAVVDDGQTPELAIESYFASRRELASGAESDLAALRAAVEALVTTMEAAVQAFENRNTGGMRVPYHGDFANAPPSVIVSLRRWARDLRSLLPGGDDAKETK